MTDVAVAARDEIDVVPPPATPTQRVTVVDWLVALALGASVLVVHSWHYEANHPYWLDEAWVATLTRAPLATALRYSSSTPLGWLALVRAVPGHDAPLRLVPLAFSGASVVVAYFLARLLPWRSTAWARVAAVATAGVVLLVPAALVRDDLKQYTADACLALVLLLLVARIDDAPSPRRYVALGLAVVVATMFSTVAAFVGAAAFVSVLLTAEIRRPPRFRALRAVGLVTAVLVGLWFLAVILPRDTEALKYYWRRQYLDGNPWDVLHEALGRLSNLAPNLAMPAFVFIGVVALGCFVCARLQRPALALVLPVLWAEMLVVGVMDRYPFLDLRTSHFLLVASLAIGSIGVVGALAAIARRSRAVSVVAGAVVACAFLFGALPYVRTDALPQEDVRAQVHYIERHRAPGDVVVVNSSANWAYAYYNDRPVTFVKNDTVANGFVTRARGDDGVLYAPSRDTRGIEATLRDALAKRAPGGRVWIVKSHVSDDEEKAWAQTEQALHLAPREIPVGPEALYVVDPE